MSDPFAGQYYTAGNPYVDCNGDALNAAPSDPASAALWQQYVATYGSQDAPKVWAEAANQQLLSQGNALMTAKGVVSIGTALAQLQANGYVGATDKASVAQAFSMLHTPQPSSVPAPVAASPGLGADLSTLTKGNAPLLIGGAILAFFLLKGKR